MLVAQQKRKNNIAEYVLYMWQIEDTLRAFKFDMENIEQRLITQYKQPPKIVNEIRDWYANLILSMHEEGIKDKGHLRLVNYIIGELFELHTKLLAKREENYVAEFTKTRHNIVAFKEKLQMPEANDIEVCFYALYGLLLLRLKKKEVTKETTEAMQTFSTLLALLSQYFHKLEDGKIEL